jgi:NSS family neurotransmitter:Na+ symporter
MAANNTRGSFGSNLGFILAAAGSAVGLGNIWKFPYIVGEYGGGAFVLVYLAAVLAIGLPLMYAELVIGQRGKRSPIGAIRALTASHPLGAFFSWVGGGLAVATPFVIFCFYSVVAGWAIHFLALALGLIGGTGDAGEDFAKLQASAGFSLTWLTLFLGMSLAVVLGGVKEGIERASKVLMPTMFAILIGLLVYVGSTFGLSDSASFLFRPDFAKLSGEAVLEAVGHSFFTLSLGMGIMITYGSYLVDERSIIRDGVAVAVLDTVLALMAGLVVFAVVFAMGKEPQAGPGLVFVTLPDLFARIPGGSAVGIAFFSMLVFAAWTSTISGIEVLTSTLVDEFGLSRKATTAIVGGSLWLGGVACALWPAILDAADQITTNYMLPVGGILVGVISGWVISKSDREAGFEGWGSASRVPAIIWTWCARLVAPIGVAVVILWKVGVLG